MNFSKFCEIFVKAILLCSAQIHSGITTLLCILKEITGLKIRLVNWGSTPHPIKWDLGGFGGGAPDQQKFNFLFGNLQNNNNLCVMMEVTKQFLNLEGR